jgi:hypothetical protein
VLGSIRGRAMLGVGLHYCRGKAKLAAGHVTLGAGPDPVRDGPGLR